MYQDYENYIDLEPFEPASPAEPAKPATGNVSSCYTCGLPAANVDPRYMVKKLYSGFFLTLCFWCNHDFCK